MESNQQNIFGIRAIMEAVLAGKNIDKVFIQKENKSELLQELLQLLRKKQINFSYVPVEKLNKLSRHNHQGAVASIAPISFVTIEQMVEQAFALTDKPLFLLLDQISDARNFGAIIRTANCTGVHGIIINKQGSAPVNGDTVKTSAGAVFNVPICKVDHIKDAVFFLQSSDVKVIAATEKAPDLIYASDFNQPMAIIMGSEDKGINPSVLKIVDAQTKLPMLGQIASLNVSVACGAILYEVIRQRL